ncbi:MAG: adenosylmethionine--8-amino-7-oxononanoate transaminase [Parachlamydiaceae bacterium]
MEKEHQFLIEQDQIAIWHPFTQMKVDKEAIPIIKAEKATLYASDGKAYLDGISSWWVNLHGHAHPYIAKKIYEQSQQLEHVLFAGFTHQPAIELSHHLLRLLPGKFSKIFFTDNGSTAVEAAIKIALQYWYNQKQPRRKIVCFKGSYHGDTFGAMSVAGKSRFNRPFWQHLFEVESIDPPFNGRLDVSLAQLQTIIQKEVPACFIFEPLILGTGGMRVYAAKDLNELIKVCNQYEILTIADEVMTGFGRTGSLFACQNLDFSLDILCLSKGITGGFLPLGVTACQEFIYQSFLSDDMTQAFLHGHSYTANPLACAAALANLDLLLEKTCLTQRHSIAEEHQTFCQQISSSPLINRCETLGTILALEYRNDPSYFNPISKKLYRHFIHQGILLRPLGNVVYVLPPYCITKNELSTIYDSILATLQEGFL